MKQSSESDSVDVFTLVIFFTLLGYIFVDAVLSHTSPNESAIHAPNQTPPAQNINPRLDISDPIPYNNHTNKKLVKTI